MVGQEFWDPILDANYQIGEPDESGDNICDDEGNDEGSDEGPDSPFGLDCSVVQAAADLDSGMDEAEDNFGIFVIGGIDEEEE